MWMLLVLSKCIKKSIIFVYFCSTKLLKFLCKNVFVYVSTSRVQSDDYGYYYP